MKFFKKYDSSDKIFNVFKSLTYMNFFSLYLIFKLANTDTKMVRNLGIEKWQFT